MDWHRWSLAYLEKDLKQLRFCTDDIPITVLESYNYEVCIFSIGKMRIRNTDSSCRIRQQLQGSRNTAWQGIISESGCKRY